MFSMGALGSPPGSVNHADHRANLFDCAVGSRVHTSEYVHLYTKIAQSLGQFPNVNVHTPRLPLSWGRQGAGMERDESKSLEAQTPFHHHLVKVPLLSTQVMFVWLGPPQKIKVSNAFAL